MLDTPVVTKERIIELTRALAPKFAARAAETEEARQIPRQSVEEMLDAGFARILLPKRIGGYGLGFDTWFEVMRELSKTDASHGWCAGLIIHHAHLIALYPEAGQRTVWDKTHDVSVAASLAPVAQATPVKGGYRVTSKGSTFASGVDHSAWIVLGAMTQGGSQPDWKFFLLPARECNIVDTWHTAGMRGTGSKTVVADNVFVPDDLVLSLAELRDGKTPGGAAYSDVIFHTPFYYYAPLSFATPMLGAVQGAYEYFREWTKTRKTPDGSPLAAKASIQMQMARAAADIDAAELLLRRALNITDAPNAYSPELLARSLRDFARVSEMTVSAIDTIISLSGTTGFSTSHPIQRAWRDIHFMSMHISVNTEMNFTHYGRLEFGLGRDGSRPYF
jgi:3-hydroxy-9,10-secoandrosta-1,3,5(10)-triene-9,17-dione monooxygenase